jgi:sulfate adenylyltransferase subunit 1
VIRPQTDAHRDFRGYAGRVASGVFKVGDEVVAMPSGQTTKIKEIFVGDTHVDKAFPPLSVAMTLEDDIDLSRGDMLARPNNQPSKGKLLDAKVCWLSETPMNLGAKYILRHTSRESQSRITKIHHEIDINTLHRVEGVSEISVNAIARIQVKTASEVLVDDYRRNKVTGSFLLIDPSTHQTVAAGVIDDLNTLA